jgi:hypothetical protein
MASFAIDLHAVLTKSLDQNYGGALTSIMVTDVCIIEACMYYIGNGNFILLYYKK